MKSNISLDNPCNAQKKDQGPKLVWKSKLDGKENPLKTPEEQPLAEPISVEKPEAQWEKALEPCPCCWTPVKKAACYTLILSVDSMWISNLSPIGSNACEHNLPKGAVKWSIQPC